MNVAIAVITGAVMGLVSVIGGVAAYQKPDEVKQVNLYSYANK